MQHNLQVSVRIAAVLASILTFAIGCATPSYVPSPAAEKRTSSLIHAAEAGDLVQVKSLLAAKADVNARTDDGETALMYAVWGDYAEVAQALLAAGADVNAKNRNGVTALIVASKTGHAEVVQALLAAGADVNAKTDNGETALKIAQVAGHPGMVKLLRQAGGKE